MHIQSNTLKKPYTIITPEQCVLRIKSNNWSFFPISLSDHRHWSSNWLFYEEMKTKPVLEKAQELNWPENSFILNFEAFNLVESIHSVNQALQQPKASLPADVIFYFGKNELNSLALEPFKDLLILLKKHKTKINLCFNAIKLPDEYLILINDLCKSGLLPSNLTLDFSSCYHDTSLILEGLASNLRPEELTLNLSDSRLRDSEIQRLFEAISKGKNNISVNIAKTGVKNIESIANCVALGCLRMVDLSYNSLGDNAIIALSKALKNKACDSKVQIKLNILNGELKNSANELAELLFDTSCTSRLHLEFQMHFLQTTFGFEDTFAEAVAGKKLRQGLQLTLDLFALMYFSDLGVFEQGLPDLLIINSEFLIPPAQFIFFKDFLSGRQAQNTSLIINFKHLHNYELKEITNLVHELNASQSIHFASIQFNTPEYSTSGKVGRKKIAQLDSELLTYNLASIVNRNSFIYGTNEHALQQLCQSGDMAAAYRLATYLEEQKRLEESLVYWKILYAKCYPVLNDIDRINHELNQETLAGTLLL